MRVGPTFAILAFLAVAIIAALFDTPDAPGPPELRPGGPDGVPNPRRPDPGPRQPEWENTPDIGDLGPGAPDTGTPRPGRPLGPARGDEPVVNVQLPPTARSSTGTAFSIDSGGVWITARHVVDGCSTIFILTGPRQGLRVERHMIDPHADLALLQTRTGAPDMRFAEGPLRSGQMGFHFGFPRGEPGSASSLLIGRHVMRVHGRYSTREPVIAWAERRRVPEFDGGLGGISGGPALDEHGNVIGVTVAGSIRRGRIYTTDPASTEALLRRARREVPKSATPAARIDEDGHAVYGEQLRRRLTVAKVVCQVATPTNPRRPMSNERQ